MPAHEHGGLGHLCPSAQAGMADGVVFGAVGGSASEPRLAYLDQAMPVSGDLEQLAAPARIGEVFRVAAPCAAQGCMHHDGRDCSLVTRVVQTMPIVVQRLPRCAIRSSCLWWKQEGREACLRCPQVVTEVANASSLLRAVAGPGDASPSS